MSTARLSHSCRWLRQACALLAVTGVTGAEAILDAGQVDVVASSGTHENTTPDIADLTAATSRCEVSADPTYGTKENPVRLGGEGHPATREVAYMNALRGPVGQGFHFTRAGSLMSDNSILDLYLVDQPGLTEPRQLYIDGYHASFVKAPVGWLCGVPILGVEPPPTDPLAHAMLMALAVKLGAADIPPISLDPDGSATHGVVLDHVRLVALAARIAAARGTPLDPAALPDAVARQRTVIVALPTTCRGKTIAPQSILYGNGRGHSLPSLATARGERILDLAPGLHPPEGALAVSYDTPWFFDNAQVRVRYEEACDSQPAELTFEAATEGGSLGTFVDGVIPPGVVALPADARVAIQVFPDAAGTPMFPLYAAGLWELKDAAIDAARQWRVKPYRVNGAPIFDVVTLVIQFPNRR